MVGGVYLLMALSFSLVRPLCYILNCAHVFTSYYLRIIFDKLRFLKWKILSVGKINKQHQVRITLVCTYLARNQRYYNSSRGGHECLYDITKLISCEMFTW